VSEPNFSIQLPGGSKIVLSKGTLKAEPPPDRFPSHGMSYIDRYIPRLIGDNDGFRSLSMFAFDGDRGFGLFSQGKACEAFFTIDCQITSPRETALRAFFASLGVTPIRDFIAQNGPPGCLTPTRYLLYPVTGSVSEIALLTKRILQKVFHVSPDEGLEISYHAWDGT
jgi:hypothetical protein